jgi:hypothetical protein
MASSWQMKVKSSIKKVITIPTLRTRKSLGRVASMKINILFPFDELNAAAFQNAGIFTLQQLPIFKNFEFICHGPEEFRHLYFHADNYISISPLPYSEYKEVMNWKYGRKLESCDFLKQHRFFLKITKGVYFRIHSYKASFLHGLPPKIYHKLPANVKFFGRQRKYLLRSGVYKKYRNSVRDEKSIGTGMYFDYNLGIGLRAHDESTNFYHNFKALESMILADALIPSSEILARARTVKELNSEQKNDLERISKFISKNSKTIFLRTRNKAVAQEHNPSILLLKKHVLALLAEGFCVVNTGVPCSNLNIQHPNYTEVSHDLPPILAMSMAIQANYIMTTASADLFTGWAQLNVPLITFGEEWSVEHMYPTVSLLSARASVRINDINLEPEFTSGDSIGIIRKLSKRGRDADIKS